MTVYEYLNQQKRKLVQAYKNNCKEWIAEKICEIQRKIDALTVEEAGRDYRIARR